MPSLGGFKRPLRSLVLDWCCTSVSRPTRTSEGSLMKEPYVISNWIFTPVSLWRNYLSSQAGLRSHLLVTTLTLTTSVSTRAGRIILSLYRAGAASDCVIQPWGLDEKGVRFKLFYLSSPHAAYSLKDMMEGPLEPFNSGKMRKINCSRVAKQQNLMWWNTFWQPFSTCKQHRKKPKPWLDMSLFHSWGEMLQSLSSAAPLVVEIHWNALSG